jgi:peroxiredoxin
MLDAVGTITIAALVVVSGFLAQENIALKGRLASFGGDEGGNEIRAGDRLRPLSLLSSSGDQRVLFSGPDSNAFLLFIFDTSCPHCENSLPVWNQVAGLWPVQGIEILGISLDDTGRTRIYLDRHDIRFPVASILDEDYIERHGIHGVPATVLVTGGATVARAWSGEITPEVFEEIVRETGSMFTE